MVAAFAREHDLFVFTDEIYEHFVYGEAPHIAAAALHDMWDRTITISGLSKPMPICCVMTPSTGVFHLKLP